MIKSKYLGSLLGFSPKFSLLDFSSSDKVQQRTKFIFISLFLSNLIIINPLKAQTEEKLENKLENLPQFYQVIVNNNLDGEITPDENLTLREAISLINNTLALENLSETERKQVQILENVEQSHIKFNLKVPETTIKLTKILPLIHKPVIIDGTTNEGYDINKYPFEEKQIPFPVVAITPAENTEVFRGLTIVSDNVTIKGLSIYGFKITTETTLSTNPADIVIAHKLTPEDIKKVELTETLTEKLQFQGKEYQEIDELFSTYLAPNTEPTVNIIIENNFLGVPPNLEIPESKSNYGIYIYKSFNTLINNNYIAHHEGSAILTGTTAQNAVISNNIITNNGIKGMPDAIRLEGNITNSQISDNLICANDGSSIYLYRPQGNVNIINNNIKFNGKRIQGGGIFLTGNNHQIINNNITDQVGPGIVIAAYPDSQQNIINNNTFSNLEGLSIDLNVRDKVGVYQSRIGDGINPPRSSEQRRKDSANAAINSPQFLSHEFFLINGQVGVDGIADPLSLITIYKVTEIDGLYGPLNIPLTQVITDENGRFSTDLNLSSGDTISAIATLPEYGTSEPAQNAQIFDLQRQNIAPLKMATSLPRCTTPPKPKSIIPELTLDLVPENPPPEPDPVPLPDFEPELQSINLKVPRNVHFALDKSNISPQSAQVLDKIAQVLQENPYIVIDLLGHTDSRASVAYNLALANRRATAVRDYLAKKGIDGARMTIRSLGKSQLKKPGDSIMDHAYNRRVEVIFRDVRGIELIIEEQYEDLQLEKR